ncbi:hypothetical protein Tco_1395597 [Tanacetum coccineum]
MWGNNRAVAPTPGAAILAVDLGDNFTVKGEMKEMRDGCTKCGGPHPSSECDDKPKGGPEEEAKYAYEGYR